MSEVGNEDAGGVLARLMRGANLRRSVEVLKAPDESLAATVSALANTAGGWILIGPDPEDGWRSAVGFDAEAAVEALRGALGAVEPEVRAEAGIASVDGRPVAWLRVHEVDRRRRPARVQGAGRAGAFLRTDEGTRPLTAYERYRMMEERCPPLFDIEPVEHANPDELEAERIAAMLGFARERHPNVFARLSDETALMQLGVLTRVDGRICPTLGGLVAGSIFPQKHFPRLVLEVSVLEGPRDDGADEGRRVLFMKPVPGPAAEMAAEAERIVMASWAPAAETTDGAFARALRAALVNALEHRDYSPEGRGMPVRVRVFEDAVDIRSPGGLFGMAPEALASDAGLRASRNERLARMPRRRKHGLRVCRDPRLRGRRPRRARRNHARRLHGHLRKGGRGGKSRHKRRGEGGGSGRVRSAFGGCGSGRLRDDSQGEARGGGQSFGQGDHAPCGRLPPDGRQAREASCGGGRHRAHRGAPEPEATLSPRREGPTRQARVRSLKRLLRARFGTLGRAGGGR